MMPLFKRLLCAAALAFTLTAPQAHAQEWRPVRPGILCGISGMARVEPKQEAAALTTFLVVHDNKQAGQDRLGLVSIGAGEPPQYAALPWPTADLPVDLEALSAVPGRPGEYLALSSSGGAYHLRLNAAQTAVALVKSFALPDVPPGSNFESFALQQLDATTPNAPLLAVWADRGANERPAVLSWSLLDLTTYRFSPAHSISLTAPYPPLDTTHAAELRHVSDLKIDGCGALFVSSASDAGDDGPFQSALSLAGAFHLSNGGAEFQPSLTPLLLKRFDGHKVEAFDLVPGPNGGIVLATDDENFGSALLAGL